LDRFLRDLPSPNRVTVLAAGPKLQLVDVGMAVGATVAYVAENGLTVAAVTSHALMHPA